MNEDRNITLSGWEPKPLKGYDFPIRLCELPIGARFAMFCDNSVVNLPDEIWQGTVLWVGPGSVEVWWDHGKDSTRIQPELLVWIIDPEPTTPQWVEYWYNQNPPKQSAQALPEPLTEEAVDVQVIHSEDTEAVDTPNGE